MLGGSGGLAPQQGRGVWGVETPSSHRSFDLSKLIFDQFGRLIIDNLINYGGKFHQFQGHYCIRV